MFAAALSRPLPRPRERGASRGPKGPESTEQRPASSEEASEGCGRRLYEVVVRNLTGRHFELSGPKRPSLRRVAEGRLLRVAPALAAAADPAPALPHAVGPALAPDLDRHAEPTAQAAFNLCSARGDLLEFTLAYADGSGEGFTVRVHAHSHSPLRSDAVGVGQDLAITSTLEEVPRYVARPPQGYAETALGVYKAPARCEDMRVGELRPGDEVLAGSGPREGRWLRITAPFEGWVQAETRDGQLLLAELRGQRPHLRQVVVVRPRYGGTAQAAQADGCSSASVSATPAALPSVPREARGSARGERAAEGALFSARRAEALRLERERTALEVTSLIGRRPQNALLGVLSA